MRRSAEAGPGVRAALACLLLSCGGSRHDVPSAPARTAPPARAPHPTAIASLALSPDGAAAVSVDVAGGVRLWPALDGAAEPMPLPVRGARHLSLARAGDGSFTVAVVDAAGSGYLVGASTRRVSLRAQIAPLPPLRSLDVLAGGERVVALGRDHVVRLLDKGGRELARLERRGFRPEKICPADAGDAVLAVGADSVQRLRVEANGFALDGAAIEPHETFAPERSACSPDARRVAYPVEPKPAAPSRQDVRMPEPPQPPKPPTARVVVLGPSGEERRHIVGAGEARLGFVSDEQVVWTPASGTPSVLSAKGAESTLRVADEGPATAMSFARGRWAAAVGASLRVATVHPDGSIPDAPFIIGYDAVPTAEVAALSPSGARVAWIAASGDLYVEEVGSAEETPRRLRTRARWFVTRALFDSGSRTTALGFVDEDRLVFGGDDGTLAMVDVGTGERVATVSPGKEGVRRMVLGEGLLYLAPNGQDAVVYELDPVRGFLGPYPFAEEGGDFTGIGGAGDSRVVWRIDGPKEKMCALSALRDGTCRARPPSVADPNRVLQTIDAEGARWEIVERTTLVKGGEGSTRIALDDAGVNFVTFSPRRDAVVLGRGGALVALDVPSGTPRWSVASSVAPAFSADGSRVAVSIGSGLAVLDAATGTIVHRRCGAAFGRIDATSALAVNAFNQASASLCE